MKAENRWSDRAKAPDPDDLSTERPASPKLPASTFAGHRQTDYTEIAHHQTVPDSRDTGDPSRPQGEFWHQNERVGASVVETSPGPAHAGEAPLKVTPETLDGLAHDEERPTIFFVAPRNKS